MQIKVEIVGEPDNVPSSERKSITVETHARRGDMFNVQKTDAVMQGEGTVFTVPSGGRLVLTTPETNEELVYDHSQGAAIRRSAQENRAAAEADKPVTSGNPNAMPNVPASASGTAPTTPSRDTTPPAALRGAPASALTTPQRAHNPTEDAKAAQQTAARPAGEKAPLPGSPVGSPPAGNEGKDNK